MIKRLAFIFSGISLTIGMSIGHAAPSFIGECLFQFKSRKIIDGPCDIEFLDNNGSFQISTIGRTTGYFAQVNVEPDKSAVGYWNGEYGATHAHDGLGALERDGACRTNFFDRTRVCAWRPGTRPRDFALNMPEPPQAAVDPDAKQVTKFPDNYIGEWQEVDGQDDFCSLQKKNENRYRMTITSTESQWDDGVCTIDHGQLKLLSSENDTFKAGPLSVIMVCGEGKDAKQREFWYVQKFNGRSLLMRTSPKSSLMQLYAKCE